MSKRELKNVTLLGIDCVDIKRLRLAISICQNNFEFAEVKILTSLDVANKENVVKIKAINSTEEYSNFIINDLWQYVDTPHVLLVQYDGFILNSEAWADEYLDYDYIGAPWLVADWSVTNFSFPQELVGKFVVGNGGFSLRSKRMLILTSQLSKTGKIAKLHPEDVSLCVWYRKLLEDKGIKFAPIELAKKFSFESEDKINYFWDEQFGFHGLKWTDISKWSKAHPEYKIDNPATAKSERLKWL
jgi:hypothetical protein